MAILENENHPSLFQFHKGTIRTLAPLALDAALMHFNSIKVQLELVPSTSYPNTQTFQFHKGTIRTQSTYYR